MARRHIDITTIQTWPGGTSYTYRGDPHGPVNQRQSAGDELQRRAPESLAQRDGGGVAGRSAEDEE